MMIYIPEPGEAMERKKDQRKEKCNKCYEHVVLSTCIVQVASVSKETGS